VHVFCPATSKSSKAVPAAKPAPRQAVARPVMRAAFHPPAGVVYPPDPYLDEHGPDAFKYRGVAQVAQKHVKKGSKAAKKKGGWWSALGGIASFAADMIPAVLPFLLAKHQPTMAKVAALPASQQPTMAAVGGAAPLASTPMLGNMTGMKDIRAHRDGKGNITSLRIRTFDFVTSLPDTAQAAGALMAEWYLSPLDPIYDGTKFSMYASEYEKYSIKKVALIYEPTVPATTTGAIAGCIFADPSVDTGNLGVGDGLRIVSSQLGADTFQLWSAGVIEGPSTRPLYTEPNGGDLRFTAAGRVAFVAASAITGGASPGNIYQMTDVEYLVPSLADNIDAAAGLRFVDSSSTTVTAYRPFITLDTEVILLGGSDIRWASSAIWTQSGTSRTGNVLYGLPAGDYFVHVRVLGTTVSVAATSVITDEAASAGVENLESASSFQSSDRSQSYRVISIPPGIPETVPILGFTNVTAAAQSLASLFVFRLNEGLWNTDAYPPMARKFNDKSTCRICAYYVQKRESDYLSKTSEGQRAAQVTKMQSLEKRLTDLSLVVCPASPPTSAAGSAATYGPLSYTHYRG
jgi:hypothetical protein